MNENNDQSISNTPYRAVGNLNTVIGNPNINMNSAVTSNIMESNSIPQQTFNTNILNGTSNINTQIVSSNNITTEVNNVNSIVNNQIVEENNNNTGKNEITDFIDTTKASNTVDFIPSNDGIGNQTPSYSNVQDSAVNNIPSYNSNEIKYENVYDIVKKKKSNKGVKIPNEFKTAIFVVLLLLIVVSCFEPIYDFFRNLNIFG